MSLRWFVQEIVMLKKDKKVPMVLVGNKLDLESERRVNRTTGAQAIAGTAPNPLVKNSSTFYGAYDAHNQASYLSCIWYFTNFIQILKFNPKGLLFSGMFYLFVSISLLISPRIR